MNRMVLIYTLVANESDALALARALLEERLVACANLLSPAISCYEWKGEVTSETERPLILKTSLDRRPAAMARLSELHPYELPAITAWEVASTQAFADWVDGRSAVPESPPTTSM